MKRCRMPAVALFSLLLVSTLGLLGCEVGSSDSVARNISVDFSGFYDSTSTNSDFVTPANSGARVTGFNLRQSGDRLQAIDNNSIIFTGSVGDPSGSSGTGTSSFQLEGYTTAGQPVTIAGTLSGANTEGNSASATMSATWIEPDMYARVLGDAVINSIVTNQPDTGVTLVANVTSISVTGTVTLTASGATSYDWSSSGTASGTFGNTTPGTDGNNTWRATSTGTATLTAKDHANTSRSGSVVIIVN